MNQESRSREGTRPGFEPGDATIFYGWFASHQVGASVAAYGAGLIHDLTGGYDLAWYIAGGLCGIAAACSLLIGAPRRRAVAVAL